MSTRTGVAVLVALSLQVCAAQAEADPSEDAAAEALVDAGHALMQAGKLDEACPKFREAARVAPPGLGALKQLADCYEAAKRTTSAWTTWREVQAGATRAGQDERAADAEAHATRLEPELSRIAVDVAPLTRDLAGLAVERDGEPIGRPQWSVAVPVDPGSHVVRATAPGHKPWEARIAMEGAGRITLTVPALELEPVQPSPAPAQPQQEDTGRPRRIAGLVVGGVGLGVLTAALVVEVFAVNDLGACKDIHTCTGSAGTMYDIGRREQFAANGLYAATAAAVLTGVVLYVTAPSPSKQQQHAVGVRGALGPGRVAIEGWW